MKYRTYIIIFLTIMIIQAIVTERSGENDVAGKESARNNLQF